MKDFHCQPDSTEPQTKRWPAKGDRMKFLGKNGYPFELEGALKIFTVGEVYRVHHCDVGSWSHRIQFDGLKGCYNGVMFEIVSDALSGDVAVAPPKPVAWILPGDDTASESGWLDARIDEWGEFTRPLYAAPPALPSEAIGREWQPIETYDPSAGRASVLVVDCDVVSEAYYNGESDSWWLANTSEHDFDACRAIYPTHWMPLPAGPVVSRPHHSGEAQ